MDKRSDSPLERDATGEDLAPLGDFVSGLVDLDLEVRGEGLVVTVEELALEMPIEVGIAVADDGRVALAAAPPTQRIETSILPVFHQLRVRIALSDGE